MVNSISGNMGGNGQVQQMDENHSVYQQVGGNLIDSVQVNNSASPVQKIQCAVEIQEGKMKNLSGQKNENALKFEALQIGGAPTGKTIKVESSFVSSLITDSYDSKISGYKEIFLGKNLDDAFFDLVAHANFGNSEFDDEVTGRSEITENLVDYKFIGEEDYCFQFYARVLHFVDLLVKESHDAPGQTVTDKMEHVLKQKYFGQLYILCLPDKNNVPKRGGKDVFIYHAIPMLFNMLEEANICGNIKNTLKINYPGIENVENFLAAINRCKSTYGKKSIKPAVDFNKAIKSAENDFHEFSGKLAHFLNLENKDKIFSSGLERRKEINEAANDFVDATQNTFISGRYRFSTDVEKLFVDLPTEPTVRSLFGQILDWLKSLFDIPTSDQNKVLDYIKKQLQLSKQDFNSSFLKTYKDLCEASQNVDMNQVDASIKKLLKLVLDGRVNNCEGQDLDKLTDYILQLFKDAQADSGVQNKENAETAGNYSDDDNDDEDDDPNFF